MGVARLLLRPAVAEEPGRSNMGHIHCMKLVKMLIFRYLFISTVDVVYYACSAILDSL